MIPMFYDVTQIIFIH